MANQQQSSERKYTRTWDQIKSMLAEPRYYDAISKAAATTRKPVVTADDAIRSIVGCVIDNPFLGGCAELSFVFAAIQSIRTGLPIGKPLDLAYLVPRWNKSVQGQWAYWSPSYMGMITVARRSGEISLIYGKVVRENDEFYYSEGTHPEINHVPAIKDRGEITHSYAVAFPVGSTIPLFTVLDLDQINQRRAIADALKRDPEKDKNAWDKWPDEMSVKSAVVALSHFLPRTPELGFAIYAEQQFGSGELDQSLVGELGAMIDAKLLPPMSATAVDVEERLAARAAEPVAAKQNQRPPAMSQAEWDRVHGTQYDEYGAQTAVDGGPERTEIGEDEARALAAMACNVGGSFSADAWVDDVCTRRGVSSLAMLPPSEAEEERRALQKQIDAGIVQTSRTSRATARNESAP